MDRRLGWIVGLTAGAAAAIGGLVYALSPSSSKKTPGGGQGGGQGGGNKPPPPQPGGGGQPGVNPNGPPATSLQPGHRYQFIYMNGVPYNAADAQTLENNLNFSFITNGFKVVSFAISDRDEVTAEADYILAAPSTVPKSPIDVYDEGLSPQWKFLPPPPPPPAPPPNPPQPPQVVQMGPPDSVNAFRWDSVQLQLGPLYDMLTPPDVGVLQINTGASSHGNIVMDVVGAPGASTKFTMVTGWGWERKTRDFYVHVCDPRTEPWCVRG